MRLLSRRRKPISPHAPEPPIDSTAATWFEAKRPRHPSVGLAREFAADPAQVAKVEPRWRSLLDDPEIQAAIARDDVPIPHPDDREGYYRDCHLNYWLSGAANLRTLREFVPPDALSHVLDFGGATGRFARHFAMADDVQRVTVADLSFNHVQWVSEHFGPKVRSVKVCPQPHFPLADRSVTLCVGISVFTHIDAHESGWLAEINRVLVDGGWAYLTILSEDSWAIMQETPLKVLADDPAYLSLRQPGQPMPAERLVFDHKPGTRYHCCQTFVTTDYVRRSWSGWFDVIGFHPDVRTQQTIVVLRKKD